MAPGLALLLAAICLLGAVSAASAQALPAKFWGIVPQSTLSVEQLQRLSGGGVESVRIPVDWESLQPQSGPIQWGGIDEQVERAAAAGLEVLPAITGAPRWAVPRVAVPRGGGSKAPAHLPVSGSAARAWKSLLTQAVERYGPGGLFWQAHPGLPARPIRAWQVWNEPNFKYFVAHPNPAEYGKLVKLSSAALRAADPAAQVALAGLFAWPKEGRYLTVVGGKKKVANSGKPDFYGSYFLEQMYKSTPGIKTSFTAVSLHPYSRSYKELPQQIEEVREVLGRSGDGAKQLWVTELSWSSDPPDPAFDVFAKGMAGQARELKGAFTLLRSHQSRWRVKRVYWFSVDDATGVCNFCTGSGLFGPGFKPKKAWYEYVKFAGGTP